MKSKQCLKIFIFSLTLLILLCSPAEAEHGVDDGYFTVVDRDGYLVYQTAMQVSEGDWYINQDNEKYVVVEVDGKEAVAEYEKTIDLLPEEIEDEVASPFLGAQEIDEPEERIATYCTHSAESYVPDSGTHSKPGEGDIYEVQDVFADSLENKGIEVKASAARHDPHDGGAYDRSRRTAMELIETQPDALFDLHRDGVPDEEVYTTQIDGETVAKVRLVVGRENPGMEANDAFARQLKAAVDEQHPDLIKGIMFAKGKYNQDLHPRALLLEFGTHVVPQAQAETGAVLFADGVEEVLYGEAQAATQAEQSSGALRSTLIILAVVGGGLLAYLFINEGSWEGVVARIKRFFGEEFLN
ncbi:stage II sporulation protein P [Fuchsiella alkaliacetigena]|uniref:stage II sporulation protein P n=1 Tax=Fuchsiella alkaliacetigena TaxID=957042 RepID=UPI00200AD2E5|nr:stage II sporulation protein P [Fuchsiella alkaliacetigena]MCK8823933.1 stage II sporulation protein P [Fuchsiella alkaliacetigena]